MVDGVEGFGEIDRQSGCAVGWFLLIEPDRDHRRQGEQSGSGGMHGPEAMLRAVGSQGGR